MCCNFPAIYFRLKAGPVRLSTWVLIWREAHDPKFFMVAHFPLSTKKHKRSMAIWRPTHQMLPLRYIAGICALLILCYHYRTWNVDFAVGASAPVDTQSLGTSLAREEIPAEKPTYTHVETPAATPADTPADTPTDTPADTSLVIPLEITQSKLSDSATGPSGIPKKIW